MIRWEALRHASFRIAGALMLMIAGAWLLAAYIFILHPQSRAALEGIDDGLFWAFLSCAFLRRLSRLHDARAEEPAPRWSGTFVVALTGSSAAFFVARGAAEGAWVLAGLLVLGTIALAALVWRFATRHAAEIGEARFNGKQPSV